MPPSTITNFFGFGFLEILNFGKENPGVADDDPAGFQDQRHVQSFETLNDRSGIVVR
jgi:hypothetical protein